jgi:hypothetical protein
VSTSRRIRFDKMFGAMPRRRSKSSNRFVPKKHSRMIRPVQRSPNTVNARAIEHGRPRRMTSGARKRVTFWPDAGFGVSRGDRAATTSSARSGIPHVPHNNPARAL